jgi:UPF0716 protein FxsA
MGKWFLTAILLLPLAEIAVFVLVATIVGFGPALLLMLATTLLGFLVLRRAGRDGLARLRAAMDQANRNHTGTPDIESGAGGLLTVLAGTLLLVPGFLTDLAGAALLSGPMRRWLGRAIRRWLRRRDPAERSTVDLEPDEWRQMPDRKLPDGPAPRRD